MKAPVDRKYSESHEWYLVDGNTVTIGITQHAADELTDITYVELPAVGTTIAAGDSLGEVESVKATSEVYSAVGGKITAINEELADHPELINGDAFDAGWLLKIEADSLNPVETLMDAKAYTSFVAAGV